MWDALGIFRTFTSHRLRLITISCEYFTNLLASSRISCYRQLIHPRLDVHLLRPVRARSTHEQIFVVEEIFDHHSTGEISNTFTISQTLWLVVATSADCVIWFIATWRSVPFASDSVQRRLGLGLQRASHWLRIPTVDAAHALLVHGVLLGKAETRNSTANVVSSWISFHWNWSACFSMSF